MRFAAKIQLVFCAHQSGQLARAVEVQPQPPLGLLTLGSCLRQRFPSLEIQVFDGKCFSEKNLLARLDGQFIGLSTWFSNYDASCAIADKIKARNPSAVIAMGGPHATWLCERILRNQPSIDFVLRGEAEVALNDLVAGKCLDSIAGLVYRKNGAIIQVGDYSSVLPAVDLNTLPDIDLSLLNPAYQWRGFQGGPAMSAFPFSGIRGCQRSSNRCEYCSIPTIGHRVLSPNKYWAQISKLKNDYGIDYFFETGDTFPPKFFKDMGTFPNRPDVAFRIYSYPGSNRPADVPYMKAMGVKVIFMGIESVLHWSGDFKRRYRPGYSIDSMIEEIEMYAKADINVWPGFLLGLPGEDVSSLEENIRLIQRVASLPNVDELTVSVVMPLPGTDLFSTCLNDSNLCEQYFESTGNDLRRSDTIDYSLLTELFVNRFTRCSCEELANACEHLAKLLGDRLARWSPNRRSGQGVIKLATLSHSLKAQTHSSFSASERM